MKINLPNTFSQLDPKYSSTPIGNSNIGAIGCLTVDAAMVACYYGHIETPSTLAMKATYSGNLWVWGGLTHLFSDIVYSQPVQANDIVGDLTTTQMNSIRGAIDQGFPVFIKIKTNSIPEHWLLGVDYNGDDIICADPLKPNGTPHPISDYGVTPKTVIYAYGWYTGKPAQNTPTPTPDECPAKLTIITAERDKLNGVITGKDATINSLTQQIATFNSQIVTLQATISNQEKTLLNDQSTIATLTETAKLVPDLQKEVADLVVSRKAYMDQVATLQTQIGTIKGKLIPKKYLSLKLYNFIMSLE